MVMESSLANSSGLRTLLISGGVFRIATTWGDNGTRWGSVRVLRSFETLSRNNPGFTLQVDFGPFGADHLARPQARQQRDFKSSGGYLSLA